LYEEISQSLHVLVFIISLTQNGTVGLVGLAKTPGGLGAIGEYPKALVTEKKLTIIKTEKLFM